MQRQSLGYDLLITDTEEEQKNMRSISTRGIITMPANRTSLKLMELRLSIGLVVEFSNPLRMKGLVLLQRSFLE